MPVKHTQYFSSDILEWFTEHGRKNLPWQQRPTAYRVWLSEVMLQQTQVTTVIGYYERFLSAFPNVQSLATASIDEVLALWSGLGYYARARNLHKTAQIVWQDFKGEFPSSLDEMIKLPGIGRSTAAAILTFSMNQSHAILDGNVKRVIARYFEVEGWSGTSTTLKKLWQLSELLTPKSNTAYYNQAMMDMGAMVCTRSKPKCEQCCLRPNCCAYKNNSWAHYPHPKPKKKKPLKQAYLVMLKHDEKVFLEKRPASGIWGGLWSLPEFETKDLVQEWLQKHTQNFEHDKVRTYDNELLHRFSHYDFMIHLMVYSAKQIRPAIKDSRCEFIETNRVNQLGLATPVKKLLIKFS